MTYEYVCTACGHEWEAEQRISEPSLSECPSCKQSTAKRQISGGLGFVLKGSGWYSDLYGLKPKQGGGGGGGGVVGTDAPKSSSTVEKDSKSDSSESKAPAAADAKPAKSDSSGSTKPENKTGGKASAA